ncbi:hypothetical protein HYH03_019114 [Edaphochlamys debaryana]|uniref:Uncharacterized protein n=1 Tax=Edaphochlamys debaryana TaxID=47281 RepID=A0A835XGI0_9CHLO|nr:hypothetical protein HYH03_019114 [Edaphochlamys debaryana]|eukprot:KAG2481926.1 hypothetical protein HYH03_019114 [Edaphochlamys debaryana]
MAGVALSLTHLLLGLLYLCAVARGSAEALDNEAVSVVTDVEDGSTDEEDGPDVDPAKAAANGDKLGIFILVTDLQYKGADRLAMLRATVRLAEQNLLPYTPYIMYVFTLPDALTHVRRALSDLLRASGGPGGHLHVMPVANGTWEVPPSAMREKWWKGKWNAAYRLMGDWRLSFAPQYARSQGHRYLLFMDDDSYVTGKVGEDLVASFDAQHWVAGAHRFNRDALLVTWGLPELAKFFLMTHRMEPLGDLWAHCDPPSAAGLFSALDPEVAGDPEMVRTAAALQLPRTGGWDRVVLNGNCLLLSLRWWFRPKVQAFVSLARASGASFAYRWNEQAVIGMATRLFAPAARVRNLTFPYLHRVRPTEALRAAGLADDGGLLGFLGQGGEADGEDEDVEGDRGGEEGGTAAFRP